MTQQLIRPSAELADQKPHHSLPILTPEELRANAVAFKRHILNEGFKQQLDLIKPGGINPSIGGRSRAGSPADPAAARLPLQTSATTDPHGWRAVIAGLEGRAR